MTDTIKDFGDQWSRYTDYEGWYGSLDLLRDLLHPLLSVEELKGKRVAEIGSGTGRIVGMLLEADVDCVYAVEPSYNAYQVLKNNIAQMPNLHRVLLLNAHGDRLPAVNFDYVFLVGVLHHIPEPESTLKAVYGSLKPGGRVFAWVYGYEGNEMYVKLVTALRTVTTRLPHFLLRAIVEVLYLASVGYLLLDVIVLLPFHEYLNEVYKKLSPQKRRLVIYDQLNPTYAKYYKKEELIKLFERAGLVNIRTHNRHGYSWSILAEKGKK